jgi:hypothetical protein
MRAAGGIACVVVGVVALLVAWLQDPPPLDRSDAREVARVALEHAGFDDVEVRPRVRPGTYTSEAYDGVEVWKTRSRVQGGVVELFIARADGLIVLLGDPHPDGQGWLLTDEQYERLRQVDENPARDRWLRRNVAVTAAAAVLVPLGAALTADPARRRRSRPTEELR